MGRFKQHEIEKILEAAKKQKKKTHTDARGGRFSFSRALEQTRRRAKGTIAYSIHAQWSYMIFGILNHISDSVSGRQFMISAIH